MKSKIKMIEKFTLFQKISMTFAFYGMFILGSYGLIIYNLILGLIYLSFSIFSITYLLSATLCTHCPYPCNYDSCLFASPKIVKKYFKYKSPNMNLLEKIILVIVFLDFGLFPIYWLFFSNKIIFGLFAIISLYFYIFMFGYLCKRCYHYSCPFNRADKKTAATTD